MLSTFKRFKKKRAGSETESEPGEVFDQFWQNVILLYNTQPNSGLSAISKETHTVTEHL